MKYKEFNKIGGTEIRAKVQTITYFKILMWFSEYRNSNQNSFDKEKCNEAFIEWTKNEEIYNYSDKDNINRFLMIIQNLKKWGIVDKENNIINDREENEEIESYLFKNIANNYKPFFKMVDFIWKMKNQGNKNINYKRLYYAFLVWEENENYENLYLKGDEWIINEIIKNEKKEINLKNELCSNFRKPPKFKTTYENIFNKYNNNEQQSINMNDFENNFWIDNDDYISKFIEIRKKYNRTNLKSELIIKKLRNMTRDEFLDKFQEIKLKNLLEKEYFDLFSRWMCEFSFIDNKKDLVINYEILNYDQNNDKYVLEKTNSILEFPYTYENICKYLNSINEQKFEFKRTDLNLNEIPNSAIAEYFVNLYMGYKLKIKANDFKKYCKTVLNRKLYPIYTAPGKQADFQYENYDTKEVYIVETTIHNNQNTLTKNELEPTARHFYSFINNNIELAKFKKHFYMVSYFDEKDINSNDWMRLSFEWIFTGIAKYFNDDVNELLKIINFTKLTRL